MGIENYNIEKYIPDDFLSTAWTVEHVHIKLAAGIILLVLYAILLTRWLGGL
ncbi:hypothetical protein [Methanohalophilus portucalensis]|uniref:Uncharacterized protein n=1 Tax=Methanohalophilus portucalensis FDF-1 TaxID=523843 RepID=A0A1X7N1U7_9EURY|nr:hypothetical protein [Methanohalophilus portucalensis]SMH30797.1 hypothetical protein SAMN06264941_0373 [Methanohalophilus portucalensis FDF-1]